MLDQISHCQLTPVSSAALNERDYGSLTGMNKDEARERWGADQIRQWRRSYDIAPPNGESLRDTPNPLLRRKPSVLAPERDGEVPYL